MRWTVCYLHLSKYDPPSSEVDIELGQCSDLHRVSTQSSSSILSSSDKIAHQKADQRKHLTQSNPLPSDMKSQLMELQPLIIFSKVEDYLAGYHRFSALIASDDSFHICRRFSNLRSRLLLLKQNNLSSLEQQLKFIDKDEVSLFYLGSCRRDKNWRRRSLPLKIDKALADYDVLFFFFIFAVLLFFFWFDHQRSYWQRGRCFFRKESQDPRLQIRKNARRAKFAKLDRWKRLHRPWRNSIFSEQRRVAHTEAFIWQRRHLIRDNSGK